MSKITKDMLLDSVPKVSTQQPIDNSKMDDKKETIISRAEYRKQLDSYEPRKPCPGMVLYMEESLAAVKALNDEQLGALFRALVCNFATGSLDDESRYTLDNDPVVNVFYMIIQPKIERAKNEYKETAFNNSLHKKGVKVADE